MVLTPFLLLTLSRPDYGYETLRALRFSDASEEIKELSRIKVSEATRKAKRPDDNISVAERRAYKELRKCDDIKILQADKATVVMNAEDYNRKVHDLLDDRKCYDIFRKDPTKTTERKLLKLLKDLKKSQMITEAFYERFRPSEGSSTPARFFWTGTKCIKNPDP